MAEREKRFVHSGVLSTALEDSAEQQALVDFFVNTILPLDVTKRKIGELILAELRNLKFVGPNDSFMAQAALNKVALDGIDRFLEQTFGSEWTAKRKSTD